MGDPFQPEKLVHLFDELTETQPGVPTSAYKKYLVKWGVDSKTATVRIVINIQESSFIIENL